MCSNFIEIFLKTLNVHAPLPKKTRKEQQVRKKPWITKGIQMSIKTKNKLCIQMLKTNNEETKTQWKVYRNKLTHLKKKAKQLYYYTQINQVQHNSGLLWKIIKDIIKYKNTKQQDITVLKDDNDELTDNPQHMSNIFNEYFSNLGRNKASKIPNLSSQSPTSNLQTYNKSFFLKPISVKEVFSQIMYLNPLKSTQSNSPPLKVIKMAASIIAAPVADIFNCCISSSTFPDIFKADEIIHIFKSGDNFTCSNYRPIF